MARVAHKKKAARKKDEVAHGPRARVQVWQGRKTRTRSGLQKHDLVKSKKGRIVSRYFHELGTAAYDRIHMWNLCFKKAKAMHGLTGFVLCKKGTPVYVSARIIYARFKVDVHFLRLAKAARHPMPPIPLPDANRDVAIRVVMRD